MCLQVRERSADSKNIKHIWLLKDKGAVVGEDFYFDTRHMSISTAKPRGFSLWGPLSLRGEDNLSGSGRQARSLAAPPWREVRESRA